MYPQGYRTYSLSLLWSSFKLIGVSFSFIIGPLVSLVDWPFHSHFSPAKNEVSAPRKVSILTSTTAVRVLSTFLGVPWPLVHSRFSTSYLQHLGWIITITPRPLYFNLTLFFSNDSPFHHVSFLFSIPAGPASPYRPILFGAGSPSAWGIRDGSPTL